MKNSKKIIFSFSTIFLSLGMITSCKPTVKYKVTFDPDYLGATTTTVEVESNKLVAAQASPSRDNYLFAGWRVSSDDKSDPFNFNNPITHDVTIYGSWDSCAGGLTKDVYAHQISIIGSYVYHSIDTKLTTLYFFDDSGVAYFPVEYGVDKYINQPLSLDEKFTTVTSSNITTITNPYTSKTCDINYSNQTMTFTDYRGFMNWDDDSKRLNPLDSGFRGGRNFFANITQQEYDAPSTSLVINFKDYDIPIYCVNNVGYLPLQIFNNILCDYCSVNYTCCYPYLIYGNFGSVNDSRLVITNIVKKLGFTNFSKKYLEYCYNLNCLTLDIRYGLRKRLSRANGKTISYPSSAKDIISKTKMTNTTDFNAPNNEIIRVINNVYDDGGHTGYVSNSLASTTYSDPYDAFGNEFIVTNNTNYYLNQARNNEGLSPYSKTGNPYASGCYEVFEPSSASQAKDTAIITFDEFDCLNDEPSYNNVTKDNYYYSTISLVRYADKMIRSNSDITKLVIDMSLNGGGVVFAGFFISSWLCGNSTRGSESKICDPLTKAFSHITYKADINGDGKYDENDYLPDQVKNIYVITSAATFSCGNLLSCDLNDYSSKTVKYIGSRTGGGACYVQSGLQTGFGSTYQCSSLLSTCRGSSTSTNQISNDNGVDYNSTNYIYQIGAVTASNASKYYDRQTIYNIIHQ